jgi:hypothetical protein
MRIPSYALPQALAATQHATLTAVVGRRRVTAQIDCMHRVAHPPVLARTFFESAVSQYCDTIQSAADNVPFPFRRHRP